MEDALKYFCPFTVQHIDSICHIIRYGLYGTCRGTVVSAGGGQFTERIRRKGRFSVIPDHILLATIFLLTPVASVYRIHRLGVTAPSATFVRTSG